MNTNLADITVVLDRSGSMATCKSDAEGGLNEFVRQQREFPGECVFTLVQFDTVYEFVHVAKPIRDVPPCNLVPRGNTALLDAVGRAIVETGERLKAMDESQRPGLVAFVILTDGHENSSTEYTKAKIKEMIEHQSNVYKWQFTFLGANQDAFAEAGGIGIGAAAAANYRYAAAAFDATGAKVRRMRDAAMKEQTVRNEYTPEERRKMGG